MECPYCESEDFVPSVAVNNVDCYGNKTFNVCCKSCGRPLKVSLRRTVKLVSVRPTLFDEDDWGQKPRENNVEILNNNQHGKYASRVRPAHIAENVG